MATIDSTGTRPDSWDTEAAAQHVEAALEALADRLHVPVDPGLGLARARRSAGVAKWCEREDLLRSLEALCRGVAVDAARGTTTPAAAFAQLQVPFVLATAPGQAAPWLVVLERARQKVRVLGLGWLRRDAFLAAAGTADRPVEVLTATPAAPLSTLAFPDHGSPRQRVAALLGLERDDLWVVLVYAACVGLLSLAAPVAVQALVNTVAYTGLTQPLVVLSLFLFAALGSAATLRALQARVIEFLERRLFVRTAIDFGHRFPRLERGPAPWAAVKFLEVVSLQKATAVLLSDGVAVVLQAAVGLTLMAFYHPYLLAFGLLLALSVVALVALRWQRGFDTAYDESEAKYAVLDWLEELARVPRVFRGASGLRFAAEQTEVRVRGWLRARHGHFRVVFGQTVGALALHVVSGTLLLAVGGWLVMIQQLTLGQLVAAELVVASVTDALLKLGKLLQKGYDFGVSLEKVGAVLDEPLRAEQAGQPLPGGQAGLRVQAVEAADAASGVPATTFEVPSGGRAAFYGPPGSGKGALADWLAGDRVPASGSVELDGVPVATVDLQQLGACVARVSPGGTFAGTLFDNVAVGRAEATPANVRAALTRVGLWDVVRALPQGVDTALEPDGAPLSHGQVAQLLVARALAGGPRLVVAEDFFEGLPQVSRDACVRALTRAPAPWTLVVLTADSGSALAGACGRVEPMEALRRRADVAEAASP